MDIKPPFGSVRGMQSEFFEDGSNEGMKRADSIFVVNLDERIGVCLQDKGALLRV